MDVLRVATGTGHHMREAARVGSLPGQPSEPATGGVALPASPAPTRARRPGRVDDRVTDLAGEAAVPEPDLPIDDHPTADPGAEGDHDAFTHTPEGAERELSEGGAVSVVLDDDGRRLQPLAHQALQVSAGGPREVGGEAQCAVPVHHAGGADADDHRDRRQRPQIRRQLPDDVGHRVGDIDPDTVVRVLEERLVHLWGWNPGLAHHPAAGL